ncbi:serine/threonine-protein kinase [Nocardioides alkalitolerans]|uniref:serine/threonine-protein kinase n=1 Tax=Nocardioides alkalitolerans TaxID=281714 RepID=UPI0003FCC2B9|nr:serine/threonine-protein kinase [Nocardioides alkalitolerans]
MGEVFAGRYELLEPIGMGGMGTVWTVHDRADDRVKAAKILRQSDAASLLRFVREQSVRIDHPHVVTPESWAGMDDRVLFTMPLVRGGSLSDLLKERGALPLPWVGAILDQVLAALEAVHAAGVVHRDVKPANILLEPTGHARPHVRLTDFGVAAPVDEPRMTRGSAAIGSPGYMAPEQWHGSDPDPQQDVYAVGRVGLEMVTGTRPAAGTAEVELATWPEPRDLAERLVAVLQHAASEAPEDRPADASALRAALAELRLQEVTVAGPPVFVRERLAEASYPPQGTSGPTAAMTSGRTAPMGGRPTRADHRADHRPVSGDDVTRAGTSVLPAGAPRPGDHLGAHPHGERPRRRLVPGLVLMMLGAVAAAVGAYLLLTA